VKYTQKPVIAGAALQAEALGKRCEKIEG